ncbi:hypothetical protein BD626DRAFT_73393 [Schizophyllum amplum]|uniref:Uncharacterized protein n=1 Tax=Schizophyllum amplum TaxID=97359 RepID=A0A550CAN7_9AGAR|nr:hypothetical protein BD626DRAFT_73393 [Auriculariopsis ampla]
MNARQPQQPPRNDIVVQPAAAQQISLSPFPTVTMQKPSGPALPFSLSAVIPIVPATAIQPSTSTAGASPSPSPERGQREPAQSSQGVTQVTPTQRPAQQQPQQTKVADQSIGAASTSTKQPSFSLFPILPPPQASRSSLPFSLSASTSAPSAVNPPPIPAAAPSPPHQQQLLQQQQHEQTLRQQVLLRKAQQQQQQRQQQQQQQQSLLAPMSAHSGVPHAPPGPSASLIHLPPLHTLATSNVQRQQGAWPCTGTSRIEPATLQVPQHAAQAAFSGQTMNNGPMYTTPLSIHTSSPFLNTSSLMQSTAQPFHSPPRNPAAFIRDPSPPLPPGPMDLDVSFNTMFGIQPPVNTTPTTDVDMDDGTSLAAQAPPVQPWQHAVQPVPQFQLAPVSQPFWSSAAPSQQPSATTMAQQPVAPFSREVTMAEPVAPGPQSSTQIGAATAASFTIKSTKPKPNTQKPTSSVPQASQPSASKGGASSTSNIPSTPRVGNKSTNVGMQKTTSSTQAARPSPTPSTPRPKTEPPMSPVLAPTKVAPAAPHILPFTQRLGIQRRDLRTGAVLEDACAQQSTVAESAPALRTEYKGTPLNARGAALLACIDAQTPKSKKLAPPPGRPLHPPQARKTESRAEPESSGSYEDMARKMCKAANQSTVQESVVSSTSSSLTANLEGAVLRSQASSTSTTCNDRTTATEENPATSTGRIISSNNRVASAPAPATSLTDFYDVDLSRLVTPGETAFSLPLINAVPSTPSNCGSSGSDSPSPVTPDENLNELRTDLVFFTNEHSSAEVDAAYALMLCAHLDGDFTAPAPSKDDVGGNPMNHM